MTLLATKTSENFLDQNGAIIGASLTMRRRWDLPELDGPAISTTLPGRSGARWSGGGRMIGGRAEREREMKADAVSSTANHALGSPPASAAMGRVLELSPPFFSLDFFRNFRALGSIVFGACRFAYSVCAPAGLCLWRSVRPCWAGPTSKWAELEVHTGGD